MGILKTIDLFLRSLWAVALFFHATVAQSEPATLPVLGGEFVDLSTTSAAIIGTSTGTLCSGSLIASRYVLTAAHCVEEPIDNSEFIVVVGHNLYAVSNRWHHPKWSVGANFSVSSSRYDLGVIELSDPVLDRNPYPIITDDPLENGEEGFLEAFGANERSDITLSIAEDGKIAPFVIEERSDGIVLASLNVSGSATCSGDSGGPLIQKLGEYLAIAGVVSAGTTDTTDSNRCVPSDPQDISIFVDLQSGSSQSFLKQFSGVQFLNGRLVHFQIGISQLFGIVAQVKELKDLSSLRANAAGILRVLKQSRKFSDAKRMVLVNKAINHAIAAKSAKNAVTAQKLINKVYRLINRMLAFGVN